MKKVLSLTESELIKVINRIVESYRDDVYDDEDYVEVFFKYFRPDVRKIISGSDCGKCDV